MLGVIRMQQARIKTRKKTMNGMECRTKMAKMIQIHGRVVPQISDINIVKVLASIVHQHQNHRK